MNPELNYRIKSDRQEYQMNFLLESTVLADPINQFGLWLQEAYDAGDKMAHTMVLSTVDAEYIPSSRIVLLKDAHQNGFTFFTNYNSNKAKSLNQNKHAALLFFWKDLERQVMVVGKVNKLSKEESEAYFDTRPRDSQLASWASNQSEVIGDRDQLDASFFYYQKKFETVAHIPMPDHWGGYILVPSSIEFWQGRENRLNDRLLFTSEDGKWILNRLSP